MSELPEGWEKTSLGEIATWGSGGTPSRNEPSFYGGSIPWIKSGELNTRYVKSTEENITEAAVSGSSAKIFPAGSVAIAMYGATIGKTAILGVDAATNQACAVGIPIEELTATEFLYRLLQNEKDAFIEKGKGGAQPNISQAVIKAHEVSLPPLAEQTRIAAKLDELLAQVDTLKARIDGIPALLKRFRQSVLAAAVSGRLTEEWRDSGAPMTVCALGDVCEFRNGFAYKSGDYKKTGIPLVRISDIDGKNASPSSDVFVDECLYESRFLISKGDLLIAMSGATTGKVGIYQSETLALQNQRVGNILVKSDGRIIPAYRNIVVFQMSGDIIKSAYGGAQPNISAKEICSMLINLPKIEEQTEIVRRVEQLFAFADQFEARVKAAQTRIDRLAQSILAKAFRGELVPQDPNDEPASVLLERIKAQRAAAPKAKRGRKASA